MKIVGTFENFLGKLNENEDPKSLEVLGVAYKFLVDRFGAALKKDNIDFEVKSNEYLPGRPSWKIFSMKLWEVDTEVHFAVDPLRRWVGGLPDLLVEFFYGGELVQELKNPNLQEFFDVWDLICKYAKDPEGDYNSDYEEEEEEEEGGEEISMSQYEELPKEQIEGLSKMLEASLKNSGIENTYIEPTGNDFAVYFILDKKENLNNLLRIAGALKKISDDILIQYESSVDLWKTESGEPLIAAQFFYNPNKKGKTISPTPQGLTYGYTNDKYKDYIKSYLSNAEKISNPDDIFESRRKNVRK